MHSPLSRRFRRFFARAFVPLLLLGVGAGFCADAYAAHTAAPHTPQNLRLYSDRHILGGEWTESAAGSSGAATLYRVRVKATGGCAFDGSTTCTLTPSGGFSGNADASFAVTATHFSFNANFVPPPFLLGSSQIASQFSVEVRAENSGGASAWSTLQVINRDTPAAPRLVDSRVTFDTVRLAWAASEFPAWMSGAVHEPPDGYTVRYTASDTPLTAAEAGARMPQRVTGGLNVASDSVFVDLGGSTRNFDVTLAPGRHYYLEVGAHYGTARRGWFSRPAMHVSTPPSPAWLVEVSSSIGANGARTTLKIDPPPAAADFNAGTRPPFKIYHLSPMPRTHDHIHVRINNRRVAGNYREFFPNIAALPDAVCNSSPLLCSWTRHIGADPNDDELVPQVLLRIGENVLSTANYFFRYNRLDPSNKAAPPGGLTLTPADYTEDGAIKQQVIVRWQPDRFAESYALTCQNITDPGNVVQLCGDDAFAALIPQTAADGMLSYNLRNDAFVFDGQTRVNIASNLGRHLDVFAADTVDLMTGNFASATASFRSASSDAALSELTVTGAPGFALTPAFRPELQRYTLRVDHATELSAAADAAADAIRIAAVTRWYAANAVVSGIAAANATFGASEVAVTVTAEDGATTATYRINVIRHPGVGDTAQFRAVTGGVFETTPPFRAHHPGDYDFALPFAASSGTLVFSPEDAVAALLTLTDSKHNAVTAQTARVGGRAQVRYAVDVPVGGEVFALTAAQTAGGFTATYRFQLARPFTPSGDSSLHTLRVTDAGGGGTFALSPPFDAETFAYDVRADAARLRVAASTQTYAALKINGVAAVDGAREVEVPRAASAIGIQVTAENGAESNYVVRVWNAPPADAAQLPAVDSIALSGEGTLTPAFSAAVYAYTLILPEDTVSTTVTAAGSAGSNVQFRARTAATALADVGGGISLPLTTGENYIEVHAAAAGKTTAAYRIAVTVLDGPSTDADVYAVISARDRNHPIAFTQSGAGAAGGAAAAEFSRAHKTYAAEVLRTAQSVFMQIATHRHATFTLNGARGIAGVENEIALAQPGENTVRIKVTAEDRATTATYDFTLTRSSGNTEPLPPAEVTLTPAPQQLQAVWTPPASDGGAAVTTYFARYREQERGAAWAEPPGESGARIVPAAADAPATYAIASLPPGVTYEVQIAAANTVGISNWKSASAAAGGTILHAPQVTLLAGNAKLTATWSTPRDSTGAEISGVESYRVRWRERAGQSAHSAWGGDGIGGSGVAHDSGGVHTHEITGLTNAIVHEVQIAAVNADGRGPWGAPESASPAARALIAPPNFRARGGDHQITLQWQAPPGSAAFRARWAEVTPAARVWNAPDGVALAQTGTHIITGLQPGTAYETQVAAQNSAGRGDWASARATPCAFSLDANADEKITAADGIIVARYLLGVTGESLFAGQASGANGALTPGEMQALTENLDCGGDGARLNVDAAGGAVADAADGLHIAHYLLGLFDLRDSATPAKTEAIRARIEALVTP